MCVQLYECKHVPHTRCLTGGMYVLSLLLHLPIITCVDVAQSLTHCIVIIIACLIGRITSPIYK